MANLGDLEQDKKSLHAVDWVIIAFYFVLCLAIGLYSKLRKTRGGAQETSEGYFLAGRSMMWWAVGPSLFASNMGSEHFVGLAGSGAATGIGVVSYEWQACWILLLLGWVFVPIYLKSRVFTMPEFLKKRFESQWVRMYLTIVALISYVFTKFSVDIYAGSLFLYEAVGWNMYWSALCILIITAVYTLLGGLMAVIFTDVLQCFIMVIGAVVLAIMSFVEVGGYDTLWEKFPTAIGKPVSAGNASVTNGSSPYQGCYKITPYWGNMFRPADDPDYPWLGLWTTLPIMGVWYWCTDQVIVQRALGAKNNVHAKAGSILAGFLKTLPIFIMVMPGMVSRVLFKDTIGCADPESCLAACNNKWGCYNNAYPKLVLNVLPIGLVGLMMAVMMAALMSSLSSAFNSSATIFTVDVWLRVRPKANEREKLIVGRVVVAVLVGISMAWLPVIQGSAGQQLFVYIQTIQSYLAPPITMTFSLGILWTGLTAAGALSGLLVGLLLGILKFIMGNVFPAPECGSEDTRPGFVKLHFMYYAIIVFGVCGIVMAVVSYFTEKVPRNRLGGLTWSTINEPPMNHGDIGEGHEQDDDGVKTGDDLPMLEAGKTTTPVENGAEPADDKDQATKDESRAVHDASPDGVYLQVVRFPEEEPTLKWFLRIMSLLLLVCLLFLWIFYR